MDQLPCCYAWRHRKQVYIFLDLRTNGYNKKKITASTSICKPLKEIECFGNLIFPKFRYLLSTLSKFRYLLSTFSKFHWLPLALPNFPDKCLTLKLLFIFQDFPYSVPVRTLSWPKVKFCYGKCTHMGINIRKTCILIQGNRDVYCTGCFNKKYPV